MACNDINGPELLNMYRYNKTPITGADPGGTCPPSPILGVPPFLFNYNQEAIKELLLDTNFDLNNITVPFTTYVPVVAKCSRISCPVNFHPLL